jgi:hypothetical protein
MKTLLSLSLLVLLAGTASAQRRGGAGFASGRAGAGFAAGRVGGSSGAHTGGYRGGFLSAHAGFAAGWSGYRGHGGYHGFGGYRGYGVYGGYSGVRGWGYPYYSDYGWSPAYGWGFGLGYRNGYSDWEWGDWDYPRYPAHSPNVTVVYAPPAPAPRSTTVYVERARPVVREYDEWGQEHPVSSTPSASVKPIYLIAFRDGVIRAARSWSVAGDTLRYVTEQNEQRSAPLSSIDRPTSERLNRERRVPFRLP